MNLEKCPLLRGCPLSCIVVVIVEECGTAVNSGFLSMGHEEGLYSTVYSKKKKKLY